MIKTHWGSPEIPESPVIAYAGPGVWGTVPQQNTHDPTSFRKHLPPIFLEYLNFLKAPEWPFHQVSETRTHSCLSHLGQADPIFPTSIKAWTRSADVHPAPPHLPPSNRLIVRDGE